MSFWKLSASYNIQNAITTVAFYKVKNQDPNHLKLFLSVTVERRMFNLRFKCFSLVSLPIVIAILNAITKVIH